MRKTPLFELPYASTGIVEGPTLEYDGRLVVSFVFVESPGGEPFRIAFEKVRAFSHRAEIHCTAWHVEGAYDTVCEVEGSEWVAQLLRETAERYHGLWEMRHYLLTVDSFGCLEVVAESVRPLLGEDVAGR